MNQVNVLEMKGMRNINKEMEEEIAKNTSKWMD